MHEHVVPIQTVDEEHGLPYLVMPVVEGKSLEQRVAATGPLEVKEVLRIGRQIASGLAAAHAQGLVHRDVKPANILLENSVERVLITDFGLARAADDANMTQSGVIAGTPQYMSPEQARGNDVDHRSDLFSLGSVLYFMCAGRSPFRAETTMGVLNRIANDTPRPLRMINSDVPVWLQDIIDRLLEKDPARRFQSAAETADLLGQWLAHVQQPDVAPRPADIEKQLTSSSGRRSGSRIRNVALAFLGGLLLLAAAVVIVLEWNKGTLTIECAGPDVAVRIKRGDEVYEKMTLTPGKNSVRLAVGQYLVEIEGEHDGLKVENGAVTVTRGDTALVRIVQHDAPRNSTAALAESDSRSPISTPKSPADSPSARSLHALEQLQGTWIATNKVGAGPLQRADASARLRFTVTSTEFAIELLDAEQHVREQFRGILSVSAKRTPWRIQLLFQLDGPPVTSLLGEYQIEGERLTITVTGANNPRDFVGPVPAVWEFVRSREVPESREMGREDGISLEDAVREFNTQCDTLAPNHGQPPLTVDETVASLRWALMGSRRKDFTPEQIAGFEYLVENQRMPTQWKLSHSDRVGPDGSDVFQCWSIILQFPNGTHTIRQRWLRQPDKYDEVVAGATTTYVDSDAIPLSAAIRQFNEAHMNDPVGKDQPPLTEQEVVAAVRWWKYRRNEAPVRNGDFLGFQRIADERSLPRGFEFEALSSFEPGDGYSYVNWSVRIVVQRSSKPGGTFAFDIREQFISCRLIDDGTIAWGPPAQNGLRAGVQFIPAGKQYAKGQQIEVRFFLRNTSDLTLELSLPNLMTHAYYKKNHVTAPDGKEIPLRQDTSLGGPVGWRSVRIEPDTMQWVNGLPILIGDGALEEGVETAICAEPGQTCCVSYTLPNFDDRAGEPLKTGELRFLVTDTAAADDASPQDRSQ